MKETDKQNQHQGNYTYIVKCSDETLYTGWTNNLKKRLEAHNSGNRCRKRLKWSMLLSSFPDKRSSLLFVATRAFFKDVLGDSCE